MVIVLIIFVWLFVVALVLAACRLAARADANLALELKLDGADARTDYRTSEGLQIWEEDPEAEDECQQRRVLPRRTLKAHDARSRAARSAAGS